jgi:hypothetical protein
MRYNYTHSLADTMNSITKEKALPFTNSQFSLKIYYLQHLHNQQADITISL